MIITDIQQRWSDYDALSHVYNGHYQQYYDLGKSDYMAKVMRINPKSDESKEGIITASTHTNFYSSIVIDERVVVTTKVEKIGNKSLTFFQEIRTQITDELKSDSRTVLVGYNPKTKETFEIPAKWRNAIAKEESSK